MSVHDIFPATVYVLCFVTSAACAWLLGRSYFRSSARLLLWSSACFVLLAANNLLLIADLIVLPEVDLRLGRTALSLGAVTVMIVGLVWNLGEE